MRNKNVLFLSYLNIWSMDREKGASSFYNTIDAYIKDGWNVILVNPDYNLGVTPEIEGLKIVTFKPIFYPLTKIKKVSYFGRILHSMQGAFKLKQIGTRILEKLEGETVIYAYEVHAVKAGKNLSKKFQLPFVTRFQGTVLGPIKDSWINRLKKYPHFQALETKADLTIMTDDGTQGDKVLQRLKNSSNTIKFWRNGVELFQKSNNNKKASEKLKKELGISSNDRVLMTVSRLAAWKKVNRAIEALSVVVKSNKNVKLIVVGDGEEKENLMNLSSDLGLSENVTFTGAVNQKEVKNYLALADIFLSLYDLSNVGNPLLEAMSLGKPIITLDVGDTNKIIKHGENGILLDIKSINRIPNYILELLNDREYANELGNNALKFAKENFWTWEERLDEELKVVKKLLDRKF